MLVVGLNLSSSKRQKRNRKKVQNEVPCLEIDGALPSVRRERRRRNNGGFSGRKKLQKSENTSSQKNFSIKLDPRWLGQQSNPIVTEVVDPRTAQLRIKVVGQSKSSLSANGDLFAVRARLHSKGDQTNSGLPPVQSSVFASMAQHKPIPPPSSISSLQPMLQPPAPPGAS